MTFKEEYQNKLVTLDEAVGKIKSNDRIFVSPACQMPGAFLHKISDRADELENVNITSTFPLEPFKFLMDPEVAKKIHYTGIFMGPNDRKVYPMGLISMMSVNFSDIGKAIERVIKPNVFVIQVSTMDDDGYLNFGPMGVSYGREGIDYADLVILEVNDQIPRVKGLNTQVHISEVDYLFEASRPMLPLPEPKAGNIEKKIAKHIVPLIKDGSTIQVGFGGLSGAVSYGLIEKKDLSVHTEMITDSMMYLQKEGVITGTIKGAFAFGSTELYKWSEECDQIEIEPISVVNQSHTISQYDNFVSINACLMVDITGQIVSEGSGHHLVSSVGGASDFVRGVTGSKGGQSFICVASTREDKDGNLSSNILLELPAGTPVSVPRADVMNVVTEYGVANLQYKTMEERAKALIAIAHPDFREELTEKAIAAKILR